MVHSICRRVKETSWLTDDLPTVTKSRISGTNTPATVVLIDRCVLRAFEAQNPLSMGLANWLDKAVVTCAVA